MIQMSKAPEDFVPQWMIKGRANAQAVTEELLKTKSEDELPQFAKEFLAEQRRGDSPLIGMTTPSLAKDRRVVDEMEVIEHIQELWVVLRKIAKIIALLTVVIMVVPGFRNGRLALSPYDPLVLQILSWIINYAKTSLVSGSTDGSEVHLYIGSPLAPITLYINLSLFIAILISLPITIRELMGYVRPGLTAKEYEVLVNVSKIAAMLFLLGSLISYFVIMPITLQILSASGTIIGGDALEVWYGIEPVLNLLLWGTLGAGILYASPMVLLALIQLDILPAEELTKRRRELIFGVFLVAAVVTPDPTLVSMVILSAPMLLVIEGVIYWGLKIETERILDAKSGGL